MTRYNYSRGEEAVIVNEEKHTEQKIIILSAKNYTVIIPISNTMIRIL